MATAFRVMVVDGWESWVHPYYVELDDRREVKEFATYASAVAWAATILGTRYPRTWVELI